MTIDKDPGDAIFAKIIQQQSEREVIKKKRVDRGYKGLKKLSSVGGNLLDDLPEVTEAEAPKIDSLIRKALKRVRIKHQVYLPDSKN